VTSDVEGYLRSVLGAESADRPSPNEVTGLAQKQEAEILKGDIPSDRLSCPILEAAPQLITADCSVESTYQPAGSARCAI
jgi:hypothetical protein